MIKSNAGIPRLRIAETGCTKPTMVFPLNVGSSFYWSHFSHLAGTDKGAQNTVSRRTFKADLLNFLWHLYIWFSLFIFWTILFGHLAEEMRGYWGTGAAFPGVREVSCSMDSMGRKDTRSPIFHLIFLLFTLWMKTLSVHSTCQHGQHLLSIINWHWTE